MKIDVLCVGKIKEKFYTEAVKEYSKRLSRYCSLNITEVKDEATASLTPGESLRVLKAEGERLKDRIPEGAYLIALDIEGDKLSSEGLSKKLSDLMSSGNSHMCFVIGGSLGLSDQIKKKADLRLSFSDMTFPHQLMRVILLEQVYRSFRIINNEPYHK